MNGINSFQERLSSGSLVSRGKLVLRSLAASLLYYSGKIKALRDSADPPWRILMYHRIIDPEAAPYPLQPGMYVRPGTFKKHISYLAKHCNILPLDELVRRVSENQSLPEKAVAISLDDGWRDNYLYAFPILKKYNVPATIYVATGYVGTSQMFWSDRISRSLFFLWQSKNVVREEVASAQFRNIVSSAQTSLLQAVLDEPDWASLTKSIDFFIEGFKLLPIDQRNQTIDAITGIAQKYVAMGKERVFLSWEEIKEMEESGIAFGSHSHYHRILPEVSDEFVRKEVEVSLEHLRHHLSALSPVFCYPGGQRDARTQGILKELGIKYVLGNSSASHVDETPRVFGRIGIHEDVSSTTALYACRIWVNKLF